MFFFGPPAPLPTASPPAMHCPANVDVTCGDTATGLTITREGSEGGFEKHLSAAIALNEARRDYYAARTRGQSWLLSTTLVAFERLAKPFAAALDRDAAAFRERGIPVVTGDFVPMSLAAAANASPQFRSQAPAAQFQRLDLALAGFCRRLDQGLEQRDLHAVAVQAHALLQTVEALETEAQSHFAMTKHIVESIGYAAMNGERHAQASRGASLDLSVRLIAVQRYALHSCLWVDRQAQCCHAQGVGIIVNDVPEIPFASQWQDRR